MANQELKKKNPKQQKQSPLNPNWAQLQQKLQSYGSRTSASSTTSKSGPQNSILGKRKERPDSLSDESLPNPLAPTNDDFSVTDVIAMDCEMVGIGQGNKSALGRVTLVNQWGNVIYDEFVRPIERVVDFRTHISGIRPQHLRKAKAFMTAQNKIAELIKGRILVGHALSNDLRALLLSHPKKDLRDTSEYQPFLKERRRKALRHLAEEFLGVKIQNGEHCPVEDARAAMLLYQKNKKQWERNSKDQIRLRQKQKKRKPKKKLHDGDEALKSKP
ncbi:RNA exonuclease 4 [Euphorbia lathyris]|uniref:RNA exonuclease 4 n=1 Tax=Euphorbia lathyris TaxID=212925 RepID=UPI003313B3B0